MSENIDLFLVLKYLDTNEMELYESFQNDTGMTNEYNKLLSFLLPLWFSGHFNNKNHIEATVKFNDIVNPYWFNLSSHPILQTKLLAAAGIGRTSKHVFYKRKTTVTDKLRNEIFSKLEPDIRNEEVIKWCKRLNVQEFREILDALGLQQKEQKTYEKLFLEIV